jgi:hypothetical protein
MLKEEAPRVETLRSALIEAEYIVNSRPLTHNPVESVDSEPLTPNSILHYSTRGVEIPISSNECENELRIQYKVVQRLSQNFWHRWSKECLPLLTRRSKWFKKVRNIQLGDLVFIIEGSAPRNTWKKGIVIKLFPGDDGLVRTATVKTSTSEYTRPITKLALIEIQSAPNNMNNLAHTSVIGGENVAD